MDSGKLRHPLKVQEPRETQLPDGSISVDWETIQNVWGQVMPLRGNEFFNAQQVESMVTHRVILRWFDGLTSNHRLLHGKRILNIASIIDVDERNRTYELLCKEPKQPAEVID